MPITEIALLHLLPNVTIDDENLRSNLAHAMTVMQGYTGRTFYYLLQVEDPTYIYIVGEWDSLHQHTNEWIPSAENQALLGSLKALVGVDWLMHIDTPHTNLPLPGAGATEQNNPVFAIVRHFVKDGEKPRFEETFGAEKQHLQDFVTEGKIGGGWRIDGDAKDEWVLFTPWKSVEQHHAFVETDGFTKYSKIRQHLEGADIKHARILDI